MTISPEAIEAAARALYEAEQRKDDWWYAPWDEDEHGVLSPGAKDERRAQATAALEAALSYLTAPGAQGCG